ncbi:isoleucine--tRNA ligase, partial [Bacillus pumilus]
ERGLLVLAQERVDASLKQFGLSGTVIATSPGAKRDNLRFHHPLASAHPGYKRTSPVYLGEYVTIDSGTGVVHSSPAYGVEDFESCKSHGMADSDIISPVMGDGRYIESLPLFGGLTIWEANPKVVEALTGAGTLLHTEKYEHSYMHCWRHKTPIIYRATSQWFAGMDLTPKEGGPTLRETALAGVEATAF